MGYCFITIIRKNRFYKNSSVGDEITIAIIYQLVKVDVTVVTAWLDVDRSIICTNVEVGCPIKSIARTVVTKIHLAVWTPK